MSCCGCQCRRWLLRLLFGHFCGSCYTRQYLACGRSLFRHQKAPERRGAVHESEVAGSTGKHTRKSGGKRGGSHAFVGMLHKADVARSHVCLVKHVNNRESSAYPSQFSCMPPLSLRSSPVPPPHPPPFTPAYLPRSREYNNRLRLHSA